jgi:hypothetical protein
LAQSPYNDQLWYNQGHHHEQQTMSPKLGLMTRIWDIWMYRNPGARKDGR